MKNKEKILNQYDLEEICSYEYILINGIKQYIQIRGEKRDNPVLLFIHGGPGGALSGLSHVMQVEWEKHFTVVNFDQRNAGKTYVANKDKAFEIGKSGSVEDYLKDIDEIVEYLHSKLAFEKLYIMGFSWGSVIGAEYAKKYPGKVKAYIGVGQLISYENGFKYICKKIEEAAKEKGNKKDADIAQKLINDYPSESIMTKDRMKNIRTFATYANRYLVKHAKAFPLKAIISSPFMNLEQKIAMFNSNIRLFDGTYQTMFSYEFKDNLKFDIPVCFITGEEDVNCPGELVAEIMDSIDAPEKEYHIIPGASHMCFYDNAKEFEKIIFSYVR